MSAVRRQESWQRRPRGSFLNTDAVGDDLEKQNEVARSMWRNSIDIRSHVLSFIHQRVLQDFPNISSSTYSAEEHIYEEIVETESDSEDTTADSDSEDDSFFTLISSGRRNNVRYYGDTGWD